MSSFDINTNLYIFSPGEDVNADEVNTNFTNVNRQRLQSDWNEDEPLSEAYIKNKPVILQADWAETDTLSMAYIKNKPDWLGQLQNYKDLYGTICWSGVNTTYGFLKIIPDYPNHKLYALGTGGSKLYRIDTNSLVIDATITAMNKYNDGILVGNNLYMDDRYLPDQLKMVKFNVSGGTIINSLNTITVGTVIGSYCPYIRDFKGDKIYISQNGTTGGGIIRFNTVNDMVDGSISVQEPGVICNDGTDLYAVTGYYGSTVKIIRIPINNFTPNQTLSVGTQIQASDVVYNNGKIYLSETTNNKLYKVNSNTLVVDATITAGNFPSCLAVDSNTDGLFITCQNGNNILRINMGDMSISNTITVVNGSIPRAVDVDNTNYKLYTGWQTGGLIVYRLF